LNPNIVESHDEKSVLVSQEIGIPIHIPRHRATMRGPFSFDHRPPKKAETPRTKMEIADVGATSSIDQ
jgi:hypothetical protein